LLDSTRLAHEQAVAKAQAEMEARMRAEQKAVFETKARAAAEDRAKQEAVARVMQDQQSRARAETEITAKVAAALKAREQAEFDADLRARQEAQARAEANAAQRLEEAASTGTSAAAAAAQKRTHWGRIALVGAGLVIAGGIVLLQVLPLSGLRTRTEVLLSERLQEPVSIAGFRLMLLPAPQIRLDRIVVGNTQEITIESATVPVPLNSFFGENREFGEASLTNVKIEQSALPRFAAFAQARTAVTQVNLASLKISGVKMTLGKVELPTFDAAVTFTPNGAFQKAQIRYPKITLEVAPVKDGGALRVNFNGKDIQQTFGPAIQYAFLSGTAVVDMRQAVFSNIEARAAGGTIAAAFNLAWGEKLFRAQGEFSVKGADIAQLLPAFTRDFQASGFLDLNTKFSAQGETLDELFGTPATTSTFSVSKGALNNLDLVRAIQSPSRTPQRGGRTPFNEITGEAQAAGGRIAYRNLKLVSGPMSGTGVLDVSKAAELSGRLNLILGSQSVTVARGWLSVGGSLKDPQLSQ
jgi:hypothetical protein